MEETKTREVRVLIEGGSGEIEEKKSRFIAHIEKAKTEEEASAFVEMIKKKYWDARHNCVAMVVGENKELTRCSDDGEPSGTAGRPMLEVLLKENVHNIVVVVTRYFGGTLLGTGGLVRAYTQALKEGLSQCKIGTLKRGVRLEADTDYNGIGKILYILEKRGLKPVDSLYAERVKVLILCPLEEKDSLIKEITEATLGKCKIEVGDEISYIDKEA